MAITTGKVRASYVNIFQPRAQNGGEPKYSVTLLIPKNDTATINSIYAEMERAKQEGAQKVFGGNIPPVCKMPIYDGDGARPSGEPFGEECRGHLVMTASAKMQPSIVGLDMQNIINPAEVYSGCYIRANINFFAYNTNGNKGVGCGLNAVQKIEDGEPLTARVSAEEAFGGINSYGAAPGQYAPAGQYGQYQTGAVPGYGAHGMAVQPQVSAQASYQQQMPSQASYPQQMPVQTAYPQQAPTQAAYPAQATYTAPMPDPITGRPMLTGGVMGLQ